MKNGAGSGSAAAATVSALFRFLASLDARGNGKAHSEDVNTTRTASRVTSSGASSESESDMTIESSSASRALRNVEGEGWRSAVSWHRDGATARVSFWVEAVETWRVEAVEPSKKTHDVKVQINNVALP